MPLLELAIVVALPPLVVAPHLLPLHRVSPTSAAAVWMLALGVRALVTIGTAVFLFVYLPSAGLLHVFSHWCLHTLVPLLTTELGMRGHSLADLAGLLPGLTLVATALWVAFGLARAAVAVQLFLRRRGAGRGPLGSTLVDEDAVIVALTGVGRGRIVVSRAALEAFDGLELAASVAHERGHLRRRHRPLLVAARVLAALGRPIPGARAAERELAFSLERDADEYAVRETHDPLSLASAICKVAGASRTLPFTVGLHGRGSLGLRLEYLMAGGRHRAAAHVEYLARALACALAASVVALMAAVPAVAVGAAPASTPAHVAEDCAN